MKFTWFVIGLMLLACNAQAEIYKWKDNNGVMRYSDTPPTNNAAYEALKTKKAPAKPEAAATPAADAKKNTDVVKPLDSTGKTTDQKGSAEAKKKACEIAKDNLSKLKSNTILYKENAKGEREYLDETAIKAETANAEKEVAAACN